jgi:hypothetical protein
MTTLCPIDFSETERSKVVPFRARTVAERLAKRDAIRDQVLESCRARNIFGLPAEACVDAANAESAFGASTAMAVAAGVAMADKIAGNRRGVRTRYGTRPDNDLPPAA